VLAQGVEHLGLAHRDRCRTEVDHLPIVPRFAPGLHRVRGESVVTPWWFRGGSVVAPDDRRQPEAQVGESIRFAQRRNRK
jgi:hypothetical protein